MKNLWLISDIKKLEGLKFFPYNLLLIIFVVFISLGQTVEGYFWIDDNAVIYKLQHLNENIGYWGKGISGEGPYRHIIDQFILFYPFFKINPQPYFAVGLLLYLFASITLYLFIKSLVKLKSLALISALVFGTGYFGLESILGITNSWQTSRGLIMALITFWLYFKFLKSGKFIFYFFSIAFFFFSLDTVFIRAHGLIIALIFFDIIYSHINFSIQKISRFFLRIVPFVYIYYYVYLSSSGYTQDLGIWKLYKAAIENSKYYLLTIPLQDLGNLFIPDKLSGLVDRFLYKYFHLPFQDEFSIGSFLSGVLFLAVNAFLVIKFLKKESSVVKLLIFSFIWTVSNFVGFYARESTHTLWSTHRYFSYSFAGMAMFWGCFAYLLNKTRLFKLMSVSLIFLISLLSFLTLKHTYTFNTERNLPAKQLFKEFKLAIPNLEKGSIVYISIENDPQVLKRYGSFFGGMFSEGANYAIYHEGIDYMYDFLITYDFKDILTSLDKKEVSLDKIYTFYYDSSGLKNTTAQTRELLSKKREVEIGLNDLSSNTSFVVSDNVFKTGTKIEKSGESYLGISPTIILKPDRLSSLVPSKLTFDLKVEPLNPPLPYITDPTQLDVNSEDKLDIYSFLISQQNLKKVIEATSASFWKDQEPRLLLDGRLETAWRGHRGFWDDISRGKTKNKEFLEFYFGKEIEIGQIRWVSAQPPLLPVSYKYLGSLDGTNWITLGEVKRNERFNPDTVVLDEISPERIRYLKFEIESTYGNDGHEIKEITFVEEEFKGIDFSKVEKLSKQPFWEIGNYIELTSAFETVGKNSAIRLYYRSDIDKKQDSIKYMEIPVVLDGQFHNVNLDLPAMGVEWKNFYLDGINFPSVVYIKNVKYEYGL